MKPVRGEPKFWDMHDYLFEHQHSLEHEDLMQHFAALGLDVKRSSREMTDERHRRRVREDFDSGSRSGVTTSPAIYINGHLHQRGGTRALLRIARVAARDRKGAGERRGGANDQRADRADFLRRGKMGERIRFHFDPLCPWAWQGSRWIREVEKVRDVEVEWRLFSLRLINEGSDDPLADAHLKGTPALRTLALARRESGNDGVARLYEALGRRVHENREELAPATVRGALSDAELDPELIDRALQDPSTMAEVRTEHDEAVEDVGAFGVPTIVLASGRGIFGPVISRAPQGEEAGQLWDHVRSLIALDGFFELKRERDRDPGQA